MENIGKVLLSFLTAQIILINQKNTPDVAESGEAFTDLNYKCKKSTVSDITLSKSTLNQSWETQSANSESRAPLVSADALTLPD